MKCAAFVFLQLSTHTHTHTCIYAFSLTFHFWDETIILNLDPYLNDNHQNNGEDGVPDNLPSMQQPVTTWPWFPLHKKNMFVILINIHQISQKHSFLISRCVFFGDIYKLNMSTDDFSNFNSLAKKEWIDINEPFFFITE